MWRRLAAVATMAALTGGGGEYETAVGVVVPTPEIAGLDCDPMRRVLNAIDASGYRRSAAAPLDRGDLKLRAYENALWARYYTMCLRPRSTSADAASPFEWAFTDRESEAR